MSVGPFLVMFVNASRETTIYSRISLIFGNMLKENMQTLGIDRISTLQGV